MPKNVPQPVCASTPLVRRVRIPSRLMAEIEAAGLSKAARTVIYWIISQCSLRKDNACPINQRVLSLAIGSRQRAAVVKFIKSSSYIQAASSGLYRPGRQCKRYELVGLSAAWQHNNEICDVAYDLDGSLNCENVDCDTVDSDLVCWRSVDFQGLMERVRLAWDKLGWNLSVWVAAYGLASADENLDLNLDNDELSRESELACRKRRSLECVVDLPAEVVCRTAERHKTAADRYVSDRVSAVKRIDGRVYSAATSLPRWLRRKLVRYAGKAESVDISGCYIWILAAEHRLSCLRRGLCTADVDSLMDLIEAGNVYRKLAEIAGLPFEAESEVRSVKCDVQTFCLFGAINWHPLWHALRSICPGICDDIRWWRDQRGGATRLAHFLQRAEGQLMTDGLVPWLASQEIPSVQIHDGAIVPRGIGSVAVQWLQSRSRDLYGRSCRVKCEVV